MEMRVRGADPIQGATDRVGSFGGESAKQASATLPGTSGAVAAC